MDLSGRGYGQITGFCKRGNEDLCCKKAENIMIGTLSF